MAYNLVTKQITQQPTPIRRTGLASPAPVDLTGLGGKPTVTAPKSLFTPTPAATTLKPLYGNMIPSKGGFAAITPVTTKPPVGGGTTAPMQRPADLNGRQMTLQGLLNSVGTTGNFRTGRDVWGRRFPASAQQDFLQLQYWFRDNQPFFASVGINTFGDWIASMGGNPVGWPTTPATKPDIPPPYNPNTPVMT